MASWDVFHGDRLEVERGLDAGAIRAAFSRGELRDDDLVRPAGTTIAWARIAQFPELTQAVDRPAEAASPPPAPVVAASPPPAKKRKQPAAPEPYVPPEPSDFEVQSDDFGVADLPFSPPATLRASEASELGAVSDVAFPVINDQPAVTTPVAVDAKPFEPAPPGGWLWAEEVDEEEDDGDFDRKSANGGAAASGGLEILDDDDEEVVAPRGHSDDSRSRRPGQPGCASGC